MKTRSLTQTFLLCLLLLSSAVTSHAGALAQSYFPVHDYDLREYDNGSLTLDEMFFPTYVNGHPVTAITFYDSYGAIYQGYNDIVGAGTAYVAHSSAGLMLYEWDYYSVPLRFTAPVTLLSDAMLKAGGTYRLTARAPFSGSTLTVSLTVMISNLGTVSVPAGTYTGCKQVTILMNSSIYGVKMGSDATGWILAPGVGIIDEQEIEFDIASGKPYVYDDVPLSFGFISDEFIPESNDLPALKGTYNALFYESSGVRQQSSGSLSLQVQDTGACTARLLLAGRPYSGSGQFDLNGNVTINIPRPRTNTLTIKAHIPMPPAYQPTVSGSVSDGTWQAGMFGDRAAFSATHKAVDYAGKYTWVIPGTSGSSTLPAGDSYATITVDTLGNARVTGSLADGTPFTQIAPISQDGYCPIYVPLYATKGCLVGWLHFVNKPATTLEGNMKWIKPAIATSHYYPAGFTYLTGTLGSVFTTPATTATPLLSMTSGGATLTGGNLAADLGTSAILNPNNTVTLSGPTTGTLRLSRVTGLLTGSTFINPTTRRATPVNGVVLQQQNQARGYFLGTSQSGKLSLQP